MLNKDCSKEGGGGLPSRRVVSNTERVCGGGGG